MFKIIFETANGKVIKEYKIWAIERATKFILNFDEYCSDLYLESNGIYIDLKGEDPCNIANKIKELKKTVEFANWVESEWRAMGLVEEEND